MRQLWIAVTILAAMVLLLAWNTSHVRQVTETMIEDLSQAAEAAQDEDWDRVTELTKEVQDRWQKDVDYLRYVQTHEDIDEITVLLREVAGFLTDHDVGEYTATSVRIIGKLEVIRDLEEISPGNLF